MSHLLTIFLVRMRAHVRDQQTTVGTENAPRFGKHSRRIGHVMQDEQQYRGVKTCVRKRQRFERAFGQRDVLETHQTRARSSQHLR